MQPGEEEEEKAAADSIGYKAWQDLKVKLWQLKVGSNYKMAG